MTKYDFKDRVLVLTGATGGIGRAVARLFHDNGARLYLIDRDASVLADLARELGADPERAAADKVEDVLSRDLAAARVLTHAMDVASPRDAEAAAARVGAAWGGVDFLVPAAGIYPADPLADMSDEQWRKTLAINLDGVFYLTQRLVPLLRAGSAIVNLSSMAAHRGALRNAHYSASKGALLSFTRSIARELGPGTRVNAVSPGIIETPMVAELLKTRADESVSQSMLKRLGRAQEVATAIAFLCSDDASFITAQVLHVNGGLYVPG
ncbi:SDR family NAD(P)-dependent oxidoreductase [Achromobacter aloeverae]|uniref:3-oxoacyl-ACP reductase n=1 Tax=Achromobacter aloeverae TaxID=1750518 RepID=A0A4Q1HMX7_9BURK|nr:SDR family NAD(P)-dependent oxidoreductase [Achromobacter aloeverae]RXN91302.1 3-oxoacyl-ACP reductase [Achromobacter aloeverae]